MESENGKGTRGAVASAVDFLVTLAIVAVVAFVLRTFVIEPFNIPSGSMETTIMTGDMVFSEKISVRNGVEAGQIVTFADPQDPSRTLIKRVIATGGQTVDLVDGSVSVDGIVLDEPYATGYSVPLDTVDGVEISYPYTVPEGSIWVMGDNREHSLDSRYFGPISEQSVSARALFVYWPLEDTGMLH
ncbi:MAG: signal peptidase I [Eggerthellaceae bacterium]